MGKESQSVGRLLGGVKKLKIDDQDSTTPSRLKDAFPDHWKGVGGWRGSQGAVTLYSQLALDQERIACGLSNGDVCLIDASTPVLPVKVKGRGKSAGVCNGRHKGLTGVRCSKTRPEVVYSASGKEGNVCVWDFRDLGDGRAKQTFGVGTAKIGGDASISSSSIKPCISLDVSPGEQVLCAGTEVVGEDSFILFWDLRMVDGRGGGSGTLLGAYWESHSEDVTAVQFHPEKYNFILTGSTDGLMNIYDLLQASEDDALIYSLNTESSVDTVSWSHFTKSGFPSSCITCVTHTNEVQIWDGESSDKFVGFDRPAIAQAMMRSNPEAVYVNRCYPVGAHGEGLGLLASSLTGSSTRFISIDGKQLSPKGLFESQTSIVQSAEYIRKSNRWVTFDEEGHIKVWAQETEEDLQEENSTVPKKRKKLEPAN